MNFITDSPSLETTLEYDRKYRLKYRVRSKGFGWSKFSDSVDIDVGYARSPDAVNIDGQPNDVPLDPVITISLPYTLTDESWVSVEYKVYDESNTVVWSSHDKESVVTEIKLPLGILYSNSTYKLGVKLESSLYGWSDQYITNFTTMDIVIDKPNVTSVDLFRRKYLTVTYSDFTSNLSTLPYTGLEYEIRIGSDESEVWVSKIIDAIDNQYFDNLPYESDIYFKFRYYSNNLVSPWSDTLNIKTGKKNLVEGEVGPFEYNGKNYYILPPYLVIKKKWSNIQVDTLAQSDTDSIENMTTIKELGISDYPAFEYVESIGNTYRFPAVDEFINIIRNNREYLQEYPITSADWYWTSTEYSADYAKRANITGDEASNFMFKHTEHWIIAVRSE